MRTAVPTFLISRAEPKDFGAMYEMYSKSVYNYFLYHTGYDQETAKDLTGETFLHAFEHYSLFRQQGYLYRSYLMAIAHNLLVNFYRKLKPIPLSQLDERSASRAIEEDSILTVSMEREDLARAVAHLKPLERKALSMKYIRGSSINEIAHDLGKTAGATKVFLFRIRNKIRHECMA